LAPSGHGAGVAVQPALGSPDQLFEAWQRFAALVTDASTRSLLGTAEVVEGLLARSALQRAIEEGTSIDAADLSIADEQYRRTAASLLETTRVVLYGAEQPVTDWWWRVAELASGRPADRLVDVAQAAQEKRVHPHTVRAAIRDLQLPARRLGRSFLILERDLARWQPRPVGRPAAGVRRPVDELLAAFNEANTRENWDRAHEVAKLLAEHPTSPRRCLAIALDAVNRGEYEGAIRWVAAARERGLDSRGQATAAVAASTALLHLRRPADALRELQTLPNAVDATLGSAASAIRIDAWLELDDVAAARAEALSAIDAFATEPASYLMAARVEFHGKRPVEALQHIVRFRERQPDDSEGLMLQGSILGQLGDELDAQNLYGQALELFRRARRAEGPRALTKIGLTVARQGRWRLALRLARSLRANGDAEGVLPVVRAALMTAEARDELEAAIELAERWTAPTTWTTLHRAYMVGLRGEWIAASRLIEQASRLQPGEPLELSMLRATALIAANRISDARDLLLHLAIEDTPFAALPDLLELKLRVEAREERADRENDEEFLKTLERLTMEPSPVGLLAQSWFESESRRPRAQDEISPSVIMSILSASPPSPVASPAAWDIPHRRVSSQTERVAAVTS
jgi:tetratricopeptide (TPR) repeat protein